MRSNRQSTYNEKENLPIVERLRKAKAPEVDILVVDDKCFRWYRQIADELSAKDSQIHLHRTVKDGSGWRITLAGFDWGLEARLRRSD